MCNNCEKAFKENNGILELKQMCSKCKEEALKEIFKEQ